MVNMQTKKKSNQETFLLYAENLSRIANELMLQIFFTFISSLILKLRKYFFIYFKVLKILYYKIMILNFF